MSAGGRERVIFDRPWEQALGEEARQLGLERAAVLCSPGRVDTLGEKAGAALGARGAGVLGLSRRHVPREVVDDTLARLAELDADAVVAIGGGSPIGLGKAVRLESERPLAFVALPTTYAGSERTDIYGVREGGKKRVGRDPRVRPDVVVYDPSLTAGLPREIAAASLLNAMAHAIDALYASGVTGEIAARAESAIAAIAGALGAASLDDLEVRRRAQRGAAEAAAILDGAGMALHHKLAHVVAGTLDLPHAETHAILLPHVVAFNAAAAPEATTRIARALGARAPAAALYDLAGRAGAPQDLERLGFTAGAAREAATALARMEIDNPRRGSEAELFSLLEDARLGARPAAAPAKGS